MSSLCENVNNMDHNAIPQFLYNSLKIHLRRRGEIYLALFTVDADSQYPKPIA